MRLTVRMTTARMVQAIMMKTAPPKSGSRESFFLRPMLADQTSYIIRQTNFHAMSSDVVNHLPAGESSTDKCP